MPPSFVKTLEDAILYEYSKIVICGARKKHLEAKRMEGKVLSEKQSEELDALTYKTSSLYYTIVHGHFKKLRDKVHKIGSIGIDNEKEARKERFGCEYCKRNPKELERDHIIPKNLGGLDHTDNRVNICSSCNSSKGAKLPFEWFDSSARKNLFKRYGIEEEKELPSFVASKYLKNLYELHKKHDTLLKQMPPEGPLAKHSPFTKTELERVTRDCLSRKLRKTST
ncbi:MAG: HNH endonuclease [Simkaniaceae bacterium]|nr:HNH endonuclease [Simkaniaceae bacterium]